MTSFSQGRIVLAAPPESYDREGIWCWICGRSLRPDEEFAQWRLRVVQPSPRYFFEFRAICPTHYKEGSQPPAPVEDESPLRL